MSGYIVRRPKTAEELKKEIDDDIRYMRAANLVTGALIIGLTVAAIFAPPLFAVVGISLFIMIAGNRIHAKKRANLTKLLKEAETRKNAQAKSAADNNHGCRSASTNYQTYQTCTRHTDSLAKQNPSSNNTPTQKPTTHHH